jgi:tetratricopeptide (TPR) repeat protein
MAYEFPRFVGRKDQIKQVQSLLDSKETQILLISGGGGIGKSHLLGEVCWLLDKGALVVHSNVRHTQVINLDDTALRTPLNLKQRIAEQIAPRAFRAFSDLRIRHIRAQFERQSLEQTRQIRQEADKAFLESFNGVANTGDRLLLLLDTIEGALGTGIWEHFRQAVLPYLQNTLTVLAGRDLENTVLPQFEQELPSNEESVVASVDLMPLPPFTSSETRLYLEAPEVGIQLDSDFQTKLYLLTDGHPILLALAVEWLRRGLILPDFIDESVAALEARKSGEQAEELDGEFRQTLVRTTLQLQAPRDRVFLVMAYAHRRMDAKLLGKLIGQPVSDDLIEELRILPFIKSKEDEIIVLHDEMQRLLEEHAWPHYDKFGLEKRRLDQVLMEYYDEEMADLRNRIGRARQVLADAASEAGAKLGTGEIVQSFDFLAESESDLWILGAERLFYALRADLDKGSSYFVSEFDRATNAYITYRELLCEEIQPIRGNLDELRRFEVELRLARHLRNKGLWSDACDIAYQVMDLVRVDSGREIELQVFLGYCLSRIPGKLQEAITTLRKARELAKQVGDQSGEGQAVGTLGLIMRRAGRWDEARQFYRRAVELNQETGRGWDLAAAFNNLGYVEALRGRYERSILLIRDALRVYEALDDVFMMGVCNSTLGEANRYALRSYEETMTCYDQALAIFEEQRHIEWLSKVYQQKAIAELQLGAPPDLDHAWKLVVRSVELARSGSAADLPPALNRTGRIAQARGELIKAKQFLEEGVVRAEEVDDAWFFIANLVHLAELIYLREGGQPADTLKDCLSEIESISTRLQPFRKPPYDFPDLDGRMDRIFGHLKYDLAVREFDDELLDEALSHYIAAYPKLARGFYASHGVRALPGELEEFRSRIGKLPPKAAAVWCKRLREAWGGLIEIPSLPSFVAACTAATEKRLTKGEVQRGES